VRALVARHILKLDEVCLAITCVVHVAVDRIVIHTGAYIMTWIRWVRVTRACGAHPVG